MSDAAEFLKDLDEDRDVLGLQVQQTCEFAAELCDQAISFLSSTREASWRCEPYHARAYSEQTRLVIIELMRTTGEAQTLERKRRGNPI
jgi:hypothetical protein